MKFIFLVTVLLAALFIQHSNALECSNLNDYTTTATCPITDVNTECNFDTFNCKCSGTRLLNYPNFPTQCALVQANTLFSNNWKAETSGVLHSYRSILILPTITKYDCLTLIDPLLIFKDPCHNITVCSKIASNDKCGWCVSQKRGLLKSNVDSALGSLDGKCSILNNNWITTASQCIDEAIPIPIVNPINNPICEAIQTCQQTSLFRTTCGWCVSQQKALNRTNNSVSDDQTCFGENWIASSTTTDFTSRCPALNAVAAKCTGNGLCNNNGYQHSTINIQYNRTAGLIMSNPSPTPQTVSVFFKPQCECKAPFVGSQCDSMFIICSNGETSCYSETEECNPSGIGCRCKPGYYPNTNTNKCEAAPLSTINTIETSIKITEDFSYFHAFEPDVYVESSSLYPPAPLVDSNGLTYHCYLPYNLNNIQSSTATVPAYCRGLPTSLCPTSNQYLWVRIGLTTFSSGVKLASEYIIDASKVSRVGSSMCACPISKTGTNCVSNSITCGIRKRKTSYTKNIIPQICDSSTEQCNMNGDGCVCKTGSLPVSTSIDLTNNRCETVSSIAIVELIITRLGVDHTLSCSIRSADFNASPKPRRIGALCSSTSSTLICNGRGSQNVFLDRTLTSYSYVSKHDAEPIMGCICDSGWTGEQCNIPVESSAVCFSDEYCSNVHKRCNVDRTGCECRPYYFPDIDGNCIAGTVGQLRTLQAPKPSTYGPEEPYASFLDQTNNVLLTKCDLMAQLNFYNLPIVTDSSDTSQNGLPTQQVDAYCSVGNWFEPVPGLGCSLRNGKRLYRIVFKPFYRQVSWQFNEYTGPDTDLVAINALDMVSYTTLSTCYCEKGFYGNKCQFACSDNYASNSWDCYDSTGSGLKLYKDTVDEFTFEFIPTFNAPLTGFLPLFIDNTVSKPFIPICYSSTTFLPISCDSAAGKQCSSTGYGCECKPGWFPTGSDGICTGTTSTGGYFSNIYTDTNRDVELNCWLQREPNLIGPIRGLCNGKGICSNPMPQYFSTSSVRDYIDGHELGSVFMELEFDVFGLSQFPGQYFWYTISETIIDDKCQCQGLRTGDICQYSSCLRDYPTLPCRDLTQKTTCENIDTNTYKLAVNRNSYCEPRLPLQRFQVDASHVSNSHKKQFQCFMPRQTPLQSYYGIESATWVSSTTASQPYNLINGIFLCDDISLNCDQWITFNKTHENVHLNGTRVCPRVFIKLTGLKLDTPEFQYQLQFEGLSTSNGMFCPEGWYFSNATMSCANRCKNCTNPEGEYCDNVGECQCKIGWYRAAPGEPCIYLPSGCPRFRYGLDCSKNCTYCMAKGMICDDGPSGNGTCSCPVSTRPNPAGTDCIHEFYKPIQGISKPFAVLQPPDSMSIFAGVDIDKGTNIYCNSTWQELHPEGYGCQIKAGFIYNDFTNFGLQVRPSYTGINYYSNDLNAIVTPTTRWYHVTGIPVVSSFVTFRCLTLLDPVTQPFSITTKYKGICTSQWLCNGIGEIQLDLKFVAQGASRVIDGTALQISSAFGHTCRCPTGYVANDDRCDSRELTCGTGITCTAITEQCNENGIGCKCRPGYIPNKNTGRCTSPDFTNDMFKSSITPRVRQTYFQLDSLDHVPVFDTTYKNHSVHCYSETQLEDATLVYATAYCQLNCGVINTDECTALRTCDSSISTFASKYTYKWYAYRSKVNTTGGYELSHLTPLPSKYTKVNSNNIFNTSTGCDCPVNKKGPNCAESTKICGLEYFNRASRWYEKPIVCDSYYSECNSNYYGCRCKHFHLPRYMNDTTGHGITECYQSTSSTGLMFIEISVFKNDKQVDLRCFVDPNVVQQTVNNFYTVDLTYVGTGYNSDVVLVGAQCSSIDLCSNAGEQSLFLTYDRETYSFTDYSFVQRAPNEPVMDCRCDVEDNRLGSDCSINATHAGYTNSLQVYSDCGPFQYTYKQTGNDNVLCASFTEQETWMKTPFGFGHSTLGILNCYVDTWTALTPFQAMCDVTNNVAESCSLTGLRLYNITVEPSLDNITIKPIQQYNTLSRCYCYPGYYGDHCEYVCESNAVTQTTSCRLHKPGPILDYAVDYTKFNGSFEGIPNCYDAVGGNAIQCTASKNEICSRSGIGCVCKPGYFPDITTGVCYTTSTTVFRDPVYLDSDRDVAWRCWLSRDPSTYRFGQSPIAASCAGRGVCDNDKMPLAGSNLLDSTSFYTTRFFELTFDSFTISSSVRVDYITHAYLLPDQSPCLCQRQGGLISPSCRPNYLTSYPTFRVNSIDSCNIQGPDFIQQTNKNRYCTTRFPEPRLNITASTMSVFNVSSITKTYNCFIPRYVPRNGDIAITIPSIDPLITSVKLLCDQISHCTGGVCKRGFHTFAGLPSGSVNAFSVIEGIMDQCPEGYYFQNSTLSCEICSTYSISTSNTYCTDTGVPTCTLGYVRSSTTGLCVPMACPPNYWGPQCNSKCATCVSGAVCNAGYTGDGLCYCQNEDEIQDFTTRQCESRCKNGGNSTSEGMCSCNYGYTGPRCEIPPFVYVSCEPRGFGAFPDCSGCYAPFFGQSCAEDSCGRYGNVTNIRAGVFQCNCFNGTKSSTEDKLDCSSSMCVYGTLYYTSTGFPKCNCGNTKRNGTYCEDDMCGYGEASGTGCTCFGSMWNPATDCNTMYCNSTNTASFTDNDCVCKTGWMGVFCDQKVNSVIVVSSSSSTGTSISSSSSSSSTGVRHSSSSSSSSTGLNFSSSTGSTNTSIIIVFPPIVDPSSSSDSSLSTGAVVGITVGSIGAVSIVSYIIYIAYYKQAMWLQIKYALGAA